MLKTHLGWQQQIMKGERERRRRRRREDGGQGEGQRGGWKKGDREREVTI